MIRIRALGTLLALLATLALPAAATPAGGRPVAPPPPGARFSLQLGGAFSPPAGESIVERDRGARPLAGHYNLCYVHAFQAQPEQRRWCLAHHHSLLLFRHGRTVVDRGWNEQLLDTSTASRRATLAQVIGGWIARCARAGFQAVEPDNLDSWQRSQGALRVRDNLARP